MSEEEKKGCPCQQTCCDKPGGFTTPKHDHNPEFCVGCHVSECSNCHATCAGTGEDHKTPEHPGHEPMIEHYRAKLEEAMQKQERLNATRKGA